MAKKKKTKKVSRSEMLADAAEEVNKVLGLEPPIDTDDTDEEIEGKLTQALELITEDDKFTKGTAKVLESLQDEPADEEAEEPAEEDNLNELVDLTEQVEGSMKRKELRKIVQEHPFFESLVPELPKIPSGAKLKKRMLAMLAGEESEPDAPEAEETEETKKKAAKKKATKKKEEKSEKKAATKKKEEKSEKKAAPKKKKKRGVIKTIAESIEESGKKGITKEEIHAILVEEFPNRDADGMMRTINVQVPTRISKERFEVENNDGKYRKA